MIETYHEDMLEHLHEERERAQGGITSLNELRNYGDKYRATERQELLAEVKGSCGHDPCPMAGSYFGNPRPEVTE